ncbi:hypothetical protein SAMN06272781_6909 [Streptomyces sp. 1222.2]|uniref:hypothetical protein n=1 Tax=Streptomyces sp. 1222.2 TaxID=1938833 RepID=UPI000BD9AF20|nr:hypothetical protein [Streptomyces sp. 1222.2]SOD80183.1 hypothetical protein SAMN06272781_6909 [Streptomyces sp. 1222.2]
MASDLDRLALLGVAPAVLEPAPAGPLRYSGYQSRISPGRSRRSCSACGKPAVATRRIDVDGLRWLDSCRDCMLIGMRVGEL